MTHSDEPEAGTSRRRGRRSDGRDTRAALLDAAREEFRANGYNKATVRAIAARADVDPAMVNHWFEGKNGLFAAAVSLPVDLSRAGVEVLEGSRDHLGERLVTRFLQVWDRSESDFLALLRSVATHDGAARMLREYLDAVLLGVITRELDVDQPELRASLCGSQMVGMGMVRYVLQLEPLASADREAVIAAIAPTIQRYLTGPLAAEVTS